MSAFTDAFATLGVPLYGADGTPRPLAAIYADVAAALATLPPATAAPLAVAIYSAKPAYGPPLEYVDWDALEQDQIRRTGRGF